MHNAIRLIPGLDLSDPRGQVHGLALANALATTIEAVILLWVLRRLWHGIEEKQIITTTFKTLVATAAMGAAVVGIGAVWTALGLVNRGLIFIVLELGLQTVIGMGVFITAGIALRIPELKETLLRILQIVSGFGKFFSVNNTRYAAVMKNFLNRVFRRSKTNSQ
jgi:hypothetical protein